MEKKLDGNYSCCMATYISARKLSRFDESDMRDTAGEVGTNA